MPEFKAKCGCKLWADIIWVWDDEVEIDNAVIEEECDEHTQYD